MRWFKHCTLPVGKIGISIRVHSLASAASRTYRDRMERMGRVETHSLHLKKERGGKKRAGFHYCPVLRSASGVSWHKLKTHFATVSSPT